jgi:hypothetical protein
MLLQVLRDGLLVESRGAEVLRGMARHRVDSPGSAGLIQNSA